MSTYFIKENNNIILTNNTFGENKIIYPIKDFSILITIDQSHQLSILSLVGSHKTMLDTLSSIKNILTEPPNNNNINPNVKFIVINNESWNVDSLNQLMTLSLETKSHDISPWIKSEFPWLVPNYK